MGAYFARPAALLSLLPYSVSNVHQARWFYKFDIYILFHFNSITILRLLFRNTN